jgi:uncharacterized pyridoxal phosphate-dependent enzyme
MGLTIHERYGLKPVINATCHWTTFGGTVMWPEVSVAMAEASVACVDMRSLQDEASRRISARTNGEASLVVSGCAAALMVGAAAIMTGHDHRRMASLPHTAAIEGSFKFPNGFVTRRFGRVADIHGEYEAWGYAHAVRGAGGVFQEVGDADHLTREDFEAGFDNHTAGVYWVSDGLDRGMSLEEAIKVAHAHGVPVLVDASNTLPPASNFHHFIDLGADLVAFSGGKGLRGPQGSGILTGRRDLIEAARLQSSPVHGIGRPLKVSKEEVFGLLTAIDVWASRDHDSDLQAALERTSAAVAGINGISGLRAELKFPDHIGRPYPTAFVHIDDKTGVHAKALQESLLSGTPSVAIMGHTDPKVVRIDVRVLSDEDAALVVSAVGHAMRSLIR